MPLVSSVPPAAVTAAAEQACHSTVDTAAAARRVNDAAIRVRAAIEL